MSTQHCERCNDYKDVFNSRGGYTTCCYALACNRRREIFERGVAVGFGIVGMFSAIRERRNKLQRADDTRQIELEDYIREHSK